MCLNCCRALSAYAYLGAHNLYIEETGRLVIYTQASFATPFTGSPSNYQGSTLLTLQRILACSFRPKNAETVHSIKVI
jgi:hypothetical protein